MFTKAIVRIPARSMTKGITEHPELGVPDYALALKQHEAYIRALEQCGLAVTVLPALEEFPDSCFVEDVAVCTADFAVVTNPGASTRKHETAGIAELLSRFVPVVERIEEPGTLEGGDVMMVGRHFYVGLSRRTNQGGARAFISILERHGRTGEAVPMPPTLHLKTGLSYLEGKVLLVDRGFSDYKQFAAYDRIDVPAEESYAANCVRVNDYVLVPSGNPRVLAAIESKGLRPIVLDMSEYRKLDGGLSCLSLRF